MTGLAAAAAGDGPSGWGLVLVGLVVAVVWTAGYAAACAWWPFTACGRCEGTGKRRSPSGRAWRRCKRCKGTGGRLRHGRRIFNWLHVTREDATK